MLFETQIAQMIKDPDFLLKPPKLQLDDICVKRLVA